MNRLFVLLLILLVLLPGCTLFEGDEAEGEGTPAAATATPGATPTAAVTPETTVETAPQEQPPIRIWVVEELSPAANVPGGSILAEQLSAYETNHPETQLEVEVKSGSGRGGIVSYLRAGKNVAPDAMPDLVALPVDRLSVAANEGLLVPLDDFISQDDRDDLFPAAKIMGQANEQLVGYPVALNNLTHMAYSTSIFTDTVPVTWDAFIQPEATTFAFPAAGQAGAELLLQFYLAEGGALTNESNEPALQLEPLTAALGYFSQARASGTIPLESTSLSTLAEAWQVFGNLANSVQTMGSQYLTQRDDGTSSAFAAIPGPDEPLAALVNGWAWAITTPDSARQETAASVLEWLTAGPNVGDWSLAASRLPARRSSFDQWPENDAYTIFLHQELERSEPFPANASGELLQVLSTALFDVLSLASSPEAAAQVAVNALQG